jgi:hypothetical protein
MGDAAARMVEAGATDSRFEALDVSAWLDEADQIDRVRKLSDPETRQFRIEQDAEGELSSDGENDSSELSVDDADSGSGKKKKRPDKQKPGKLPEGFRKAMTDNSRDAADNALKRFFSGR